MFVVQAGLRKRLNSDKRLKSLIPHPSCILKGTESLHVQYMLDCIFTMSVDIKQPIQDLNGINLIIKCSLNQYIYHFHHYDINFKRSARLICAVINRV